MPVTAIDRRRAGAWLLAMVTLAAALGAAARFPAFPLALTTLLALGAAAVVWRPAAVLVIVPAAMPLLDLATLSGRVLVDEFDLLQLAVLPLAWARAGARDPLPLLPLPPRSALLAFAVLASSLVASIVRGGWPWPLPDAAAWAGLPGPWNAIRIGKGAIWALAFVVVARRVAGGASADALALVGRGLIFGLAGTVAIVLWERAAFVGLFDFEADYRVTGPFSAMHTGGATIECFLAVGAAAAMSAFLQTRRAAWRTALAVLLASTSYAVMVTYSRNGYAALLAAVAVMALAFLRRQSERSLRRWLAGAGVAVAMVAAAVPVLLGGFAQQRLAQTGRDYAVRLAHWRDALALRDGDLFTTLFGAGLGRFPELHFWRSAETAHAGVFSIVANASPPRLRLGAGAPVYVEQIVNIGAGRRADLTLSVHLEQGARLGIALCEKWMLTSMQCARVEPDPAPSGAGWQRAHWQIDTTGWTPARSGLRRPVKLSLYHAGGQGAIEVADLRLVGNDGHSLLANGDFSAGLDRWFYTTDVDPPWHIHSLPVTVLVEQGWFGVFAWSQVSVFALAGAARRSWRGELVAAGVLAALVAFGVSGLVNSLIDTPRLLWLWCILLWSGARMWPPPPPDPLGNAGAPVRRV